MLVRRNTRKLPPVQLPSSTTLAQSPSPPPSAPPTRRVAVVRRVEGEVVLSGARRVRVGSTKRGRRVLPRNSRGEVKAHAVLGPVGEYEAAEAARYGREERAESPPPEESEGSEGWREPEPGEVVAYLAASAAREAEEREAREARMLIHERMAEGRQERALARWERQKARWRALQAKLAARVAKAEEDLVFVKAEEYRALVEERAIIDNAIPMYETGGRSAGESFWPEHIRIGNDITGLTATIPARKLEPVERIRSLPLETMTAQSILDPVPGQGGHTLARGYAGLVRPSDYMRKRKSQLKKYIASFQPGEPEFGALAVIGQSPFFASSLAATAAQLEGGGGGGDTDSWAGTEDTRGDFLDLGNELESGCEGLEDLDGDLDEMMGMEYIPKLGQRGVGQDALAASAVLDSLRGMPRHLQAGSRASSLGMIEGPSLRVSAESLFFETSVNAAARKTLHTFNNGSTVIHYKWERVELPNELGVTRDSKQRFYFHDLTGTVLPGSAHDFAFVFTTPNAGQFRELWQLTTSPETPGSPFRVELRAMAIGFDHKLEVREALEYRLEIAVIRMAASEILDEIISSIVDREYDDPLEEGDAENALGRKFYASNPGTQLAYRPEWYAALAEVARGAGVEGWAGSLSELEAGISRVEDYDVRNEYAARFNHLINEVSYVPVRAPVATNYSIVYGLLVDLIDELPVRADMIRDRNQLDPRPFLRPLPPPVAASLASDPSGSSVDINHPAVRAALLPLMARTMTSESELAMATSAAENTGDDASPDDHHHERPGMVRSRSKRNVTSSRSSEARRSGRGSKRESGEDDLRSAFAVRADWVAAATPENWSFDVAEREERYREELEWEVRGMWVGLVERMGGLCGWDGVWEMVEPEFAADLA